jgi:hypothetical protein
MPVILIRGSGQALLTLWRNILNYWKGYKMTFENSRKFMVQDIMAMQQLKPEQVLFLDKVNDDGIYKLWRDLVNLTLSEQLNNE